MAGTTRVQDHVRTAILQAQPNWVRKKVLLGKSLFPARPKSSERIQAARTLSYPDGWRQNPYQESGL